MIIHWLQKPLMQFSVIDVVVVLIVFAGLTLVAKKWWL
jgi:hypothetical protein